jgi:hypothetical protein
MVPITMHIAGFRGAHCGRRGSNVYEVNPWLWQFGRGKSRLGGLTVKETAERKKAALEEKFKRGWESCRRSKADKA